MNVITEQKVTQSNMINCYLILNVSATTDTETMRNNKWLTKEIAKLKRTTGNSTTPKHYKIKRSINGFLAKLWNNS